MTVANISMYLNDEDLQIYLDHKEELNAQARDAFKKRVKQIKKAREKE